MKYGIKTHVLSKCIPKTFLGCILRRIRLKYALQRKYTFMVETM